MYSRIGSLFSVCVCAIFSLSAQADETITFEGIAAGTIVSSVHSAGGVGPVSVSGSNQLLSGNSAIIFNSASPTGDDPDLGTPNEHCMPPGPGVGVGGIPGAAFPNCTPLGNVIIVSENLVDSNGDGLIDDPDDTLDGNPMLTFDFSAVGPVILHSLTILDIDANPNAKVYLYSVSNSLLQQVSIPFTGNNGKFVLSLGSTPNVRKMVIALKGSGAIDNIVFTPPTPTGACCLNDGTCLSNRTADQCMAAGGIYRGDNSICTPNPCTSQPVTGACCKADGTCAELTESMCMSQGGAFHGSDTECATINCPQPPEACCIGDGTCINVSAENCMAQGGTPQGAGSRCDTAHCPQPPVACCLDDGTCINVSAENCMAQGGTPQGAGSRCDTAHCPQPPVACCLDDGTCINVSAEACMAQGGTPQGVGTQCETTVCHSTGGQGCTPGYWKQSQHFGSWTLYTRSDKYDVVFNVTAFGNKTLLQVLNLGGGGLNALGRHSVAALLNASNPDVQYAFSRTLVIAMVQDAVATHNYESVKNAFATENERGCPLGRNPGDSGRELLTGENDSGDDNGNSPIEVPDSSMNGCGAGSMLGANLLIIPMLFGLTLNRRNRNRS